MTKIILPIIGVIVFILLLIFLAEKVKKSQIKTAGNAGEMLAAQVISKYLSREDYLFTKVQIAIRDNRKTELDCVVVNQYGIFIFEVKNLVGTLYGSIDDDEWRKVKVTEAGNAYEKSARNPVKQLRREIFLTKSFLKENGIDVWVDGCVYLINRNAPFKCKEILEDEIDISAFIHPKTGIRLNPAQVNKISRLFMQ